MSISRNPLRIDPSRTAMLRRQFVADLKRRIESVRVNALAWIRANMEPPTVNAPNYTFETDDLKLKRFNRWLQRMIDKGILEVSPTTGEPQGMRPWMYKYIQSAYKQGAIKSYIAVRPQLGKSQPFYDGSKAQFLESAFSSPERLSKMQLLYTRDFENLKGVTADMSMKMSRVFADAMAQGKGAKETARALSKISGISKGRAGKMARTEIIYAHAEGQLDGLEDLGVEEVKAEVEFSTAGDDAVCPICDSLNGRTFTIQEARGVIPVHPECRCAWIPVA